jgi:hypothetical protein
MTLPDGMTQALDLAARSAFAIFEDLSLLGSGASAIPTARVPAQDVALEPIESILTNYHELFRKVCLSSALPIRDLYDNSCLQITLMFTEF